MPKNNDGKKIIATNKKAYHDYFVLSTYEAGLQLFGTEALGVHISPYEKGNIFNRDPLREKKLLMHKKEIMKLLGQVGQEGLSIIPLSLYFKDQYVKLEIGLCKGKKLYDKRETDAKKQAARSIERYEKSNGRYE